MERTEGDKEKRKRIKEKEGENVWRKTKKNTLKMEEIIVKRAKDGRTKKKEKMNYG